jgi:hypothetical protein
VARPRVQIERMTDALNERLFPTVTVWNRLEGRPRKPDFERALRAEVRDALWMLTRQWQLGEFHGDDAGSPVLARLEASTAQLTSFRPRDRAAEPLGDGPLEATVERRPIALTLDLRLLMGRQWLKMTAAIGDHRQAFVERYPVDPPGPADAGTLAHQEAARAFAAATGRLMDGGKLYLQLTAATRNRAYDGIPDVAPADRRALDEQAKRFVAWFERLFLQPAGDDAWVSERLEYQFECAAGKEVLAAEEYSRERLDWYAVDRKVAVDAGGEAVTQTLIPTPVEFDGMPNTRWWAFEDGRTNFAAIDPATTDLAKLLFVEFGVVYANDWLVVPCTLPTGAIARIRALTVTDVFGERFPIEPAGDRQRWSMFDAPLVLLPTAPKVQQTDPVEEVVLVRDEMANMVWGVERVVQLPSGHARRGSEAADETRRWFERLAGPSEDGASEPQAVVRYRVMTSVPENWIPFVPVRVAGSNREIQLQRAAMPRAVEGAPSKVEPRTALLREGLDRPPRTPYFVHEEEVPRAGVRVAQSFQRTRWRDGRVVVWLGAHKRVAQGVASSGLAFDQLVPRGR